MAIPDGTRLGPYEILAAIGGGGMGKGFHAPHILPEILASSSYRNTALLEAENGERGKQSHSGDGRRGSGAFS
jgi:hypothetical protein